MWLLVMCMTLALIFKEEFKKKLKVDIELQKEMSFSLWQIVSHDGCDSLVTIHGDSHRDKAMLLNG